jgi:hypothetical protein
MLKMVVGVAVGAVIGLALSYFGKCSSGACPLTSNPLLSMAMGALFGFLMTRGR